MFDEHEVHNNFPGMLEDPRFDKNLEINKKLLKNYLLIPYLLKNDDKPILDIKDGLAVLKEIFLMDSESGIRNLLEYFLLSENDIDVKSDKDIKEFTTKSLSVYLKKSFNIYLSFLEMIVKYARSDSNFHKMCEDVYYEKTTSLKDSPAYKIFGKKKVLDNKDLLTNQLKYSIRDQYSSLAKMTMKKSVAYLDGKLKESLLLNKENNQKEIHFNEILNKTITHTFSTTKEYKIKNLVDSIVFSTSREEKYKSLAILLDCDEEELMKYVDELIESWKLQ